MIIKLIVGLGNPGSKHAATRHNMGAWYVYQLAYHLHQTLKEDKKFFGYTAKYSQNNHKINLLIPNTFMNLSGKSVAAIATFYNIQTEEILVAHDDLDLLPGNARIKFGGGTGGHNGLKSVIHYLDNNSNFYRIRIGIGHPGDKYKVVGFILSQPSINEETLIRATINEAVLCTDLLLKMDAIKAMNRLHKYKAI